MVPDASAVESSANTVKSELAVIGISVSSATSVDAESSVEVATILIGKPFALAPVEVSLTLNTTVSDWPMPKFTDVFDNESSK